MNNLYHLLTVVSAILALGLIAFGLFGHQGIWDALEMRSRVDQLESTIEAVEASNIDLIKEIRRLQTDEKRYERLAREQLGMAKEGEVIYLFSEKPVDTQ